MLERKISNKKRLAHKSNSVNYITRFKQQLQCKKLQGFVFYSQIYNKLRGQRARSDVKFQIKSVLLINPIQSTTSPDSSNNYSVRNYKVLFFTAQIITNYGANV